eukprot:CCRYP_001986-RA/>CCRYP_001986-RA protein AED:0.37 eAED:0.37 QI:81/1/1/1/1/1/2/338/274
MNCFKRKRPFQSISDENETSECGHVVEQGEDCLDDKDVPVISELQKSLDYLITRSVNGVVAVNNKHSSSPDPDSALHEQAQNLSNTNTKANPQDTSNNQALHAIPNLINRILLEHYPASNIKEKPSSDSFSKSTTMTFGQKILMTQLLIAVIVEFAEPHFARMLKLREGTRMTKSRTELPSESSPNDSSQNSNRFSIRAVAWATSCLSCLLQTTLSTDESTHIPELDALLGATGEMDGMIIEEMMRRSILCGVMGSRLNELGSMFGCKMGAERT